ncbi:MAG: O-antigen ligase domain-containing protein, partial [Isosphaeraceae bacterium]
AAFLLNSAVGVVLISGGAEGLFGYILPGSAPAWAPTIDDLLESPAPAALRRLETPARLSRSAPEKVALVPDRPYLFGTLMGGPGALLAMGSMALPLGLSILLHVLAPRGSRESLGERLRHSGLGGLAVLLTILLAAGAFLAGMMSGPWFCLPFVAAIILVGLPSAATPEGRWSTIGLTMFLLVSLGLGATMVSVWSTLFRGQPPVAPISWDATRLFWAECLPILGDFPAIGTGFGSFRTIHSYFQTQDSSAGMTMSTVLRCGVEAGLAGWVLLVLAGLWSAVRLPSCLKKVGTADRALAHGLIGAFVGFSLWSLLHWTVELPAVAISASALGGSWNRWLAGGTDLFVERG